MIMVILTIMGISDHDISVNGNNDRDEKLMVM